MLTNLDALSLMREIQYMHLYVNWNISAMTVTWTGLGSNNSWNNPSNWSGNAIPFSYDSVLIGAANTSIAISAPSGTSAGSLTIGDGGTNEAVQITPSGTFSLTGGTPLTVVSGASLTTVGGVINTNGEGLLVQANASYFENGGSLATNDITVSGTITLTGQVDDHSGNVFGSGTIDINGGTLKSDAGGNLLQIDSGSPTIDIENSGTVWLRNPQNAAAINFGAGSNDLVLPDNVQSVGTPVTDFGPGDRITVQGTDIVSESVTENPNGTYTIALYANPWYASLTLANVTLAPGVTGSQVKYMVADGVTTIYVAPCFLRGTHIATLHGETRVEALSAGDLVATRLNGRTVYRKIRWIGHQTVDLAQLGYQPDAYPVRVCAEAFGPNIPHRDLLVTSEHCIFVDGKLIPVRMLVNGRSIQVDTSITSYEYFHIELETHAILISEGLETESYLDTGNRGKFANAAAPTGRPGFELQPGHRSWQHDAAASLAVDRETVEPIWRRLAAYAAATGFEPARAAVDLTSEPDLHLVTEDGQTVRPVQHDGTRYRFVVPRHASGLRLVSRASRPSDVVGPFVDDRRELGVLVGRVTLRDEFTEARFQAHLSPAQLGGWHAREGVAPHRWTDGNAALPVDLSMFICHEVDLNIEVVHAGPFAAPAGLAA
jgi:antigen 43